MINTNMLNGMAKLLVGESVILPSHMAFGTGTTVLAPGDTTVSGEFYRDTLDALSSTGNIAKYQYNKLAATATSDAINVVGLLNSASGGDLWGAMLMASILQTTAFDLDVEIWVSNNSV